MNSAKAKVCLSSMASTRSIRRAICHLLVSLNASVGAFRVPENLSELIDRFCNTHGRDAQRLHTWIRVELTYPLVKNSAGELIKVVKTISGLAHWDDSQNYKNLETDQ